MKNFLINKNSDRLLIFFTGWGCDEYEFEHLQSDCDVLILYDYCDLSLDFDFSEYKKFNLLAFSAGVFVASVMKFDFKIDKRVAINGNPYLFDEKLGLSKKMQNILYNITEETAEDFGRNYLVKTDKEWANFHPSRRTLESCKTEFECLKQIYEQNYQNIEDIYDTAFIGEDDRIFDVEIQKEFYGNKLKIVKNARHNLFFRVNSYEEFLI